MVDILQAKYFQMHFVEWIVLYFVFVGTTDNNVASA